MMDPNQNITLSLGSPLYMVPEVIDSKKYDSKVDIWSLGVIAYIILTGAAPFNGKTRAEIFDSIREDKVLLNKLNHYYNGGAHVKDFILKCLERNPKNRWSAAQLLEHPWIKSLVKDEEVPDSELNDTGLNIYTFKQSSLFQSSVIAYLVGLKSNKDDLANLSRIFKKLDVSKDGYLSPDEIINGMQKLETSFVSCYGKNPDWQTVIAAIDANQDGQIDYDEFMTAAANRANLLNTTNLKAAFKVFDKNGDGKISAKEIKMAFERGNLAELKAHGVTVNDQFWIDLVSEIDLNNDGEVDFQEFEIYMMQLIEQGQYLGRAEMMSAENV